MSNNPKFEIRDFRIDADGPEAGLDYVHFSFSVFSPDFQEMDSIRAGVALRELVPFIEEKDARVGEYVKGAWSGLHGILPQESKALEVLKEEDFDFFYWVEAYVREKMDIWAIYDHQLAIVSDPELVGMVFEVHAAVKTLLAAMEPSKRFHMARHDLFQKVFKSINQIVIEEHPEILEKEPEHIKKLEQLFYDHLTPLVTEVMKLTVE